MINSHMFAYGSGGGHAMAQPSLPTSGPSDADLQRLEDRVDRLALINMAMWSLLRDKTNLTEQDLMERVKLIDLLDGKEDGKATRTVSKCTACNRPMHPRHQKCIYCGSEKLIESAFDTI